MRKDINYVLFRGLQWRNFVVYRIFIFLSIDLSVYLFVYLSAYLSIYQSAYLFIYQSLSIYLFIYLFVYISIYLFQIKEHKLEGIQEENLTLLEERDSLQLRLSSLMRQMESAANSRAMTPVPGGGANSGSFSSPGYGVLDPQQQILELNSK